MKKLFFIILCLIFCQCLFAENIEVLDKISPKTILCREDTPYIYMSLIIKTGIVSESDYNAGMGAFISNLLLVQTKNNSEESVRQIFYESGCNLTLDVNLDYLEIRAIITKKNFSKALDIIAECLTENKITNENIEKAKNTSLERLTAEYDSTFNRLYNSLKQNLYLGNPYKRNLYGNIQTIKNIDKRMTVNYYKENFSPFNLVLTVVGDIDSTSLGDIVKRAFYTGYKYKKRNIYDFNDELKNNKYVDLINYNNTDPLSYYMLGYFAPGVQEKDYYANLVLCGILGEGKSSIVFQNIRQKYGIGYMIGFKTEKLRRQSHSYLYVSCLDKDNRKIKIAKDEFLNTIENIKANGVSESDLNRSKIYITQQYNIENLDPLTKAHNICWNEAICEDFRNYNLFNEKINLVSNEDIKKVAKKYFNNYVEIISTPEKINE